MATKRIVPRAYGEGGIGRADKMMGPSYFTELGLSPAIRMHEASIPTNNATPTPIWYSLPIAAGQALQVLAMVVGADDSGATCGSYTRVFSVRGTGTGPVLMGSNTLGRDYESGATTMNVTGAISGNQFVLQVTGRASTAMIWRTCVIALYKA